MALNKGYLTSDKTTTGDECYTPYYAVDPILKYIDKDKIIWCPFDEKWSAFYQTLKNNGYNVIRTSLIDGKDFFKYKPEKFDIIVSNPPFSKKDKVLKRLFELGKPFMILLPIQSIQSIQRVKLYMDYGLELLCFDKRISYHTNNFKEYKKGNAFASAYFCNKILPEKLIFENLNEYTKELI